MVYTRYSISVLEGGTHTCTERERDNKLLYIDFTVSLLCAIRDGLFHSFTKYVLGSTVVSKPDFMALSLAEG